MVALSITHSHQTSAPSIDWSSTWQIIGASAFLALCSQIKIVLPFTFVPLTLQTLAVLLVGAQLGSHKGAYAVLLFYAQILMGLPVLAGGAANPLVFIGPHGGYVMGFFVQAFCMGWFVERQPFSPSVSLLVGGIIACTLQLMFGAMQLSSLIGWNSAMRMGVYPFIPGEVLKTLLVSFILSQRAFKLNKVS